MLFLDGLVVVEVLLSTNFFRKLAAVRQQLTLLHKEDYNGLSQRVATAEQNLKSCQEALSISPTDTIFQTDEAHLIEVKQQSIVGQICNHYGTIVHGVDKGPLCSLVNALKIKNALFSIGNYKSPGYDGFSTGFYKSAWSVVGDDFIKDVQACFRTGKLAKKANVTVLTLIPKKDVVTLVKDFRLIACCMVLYKTISKILELPMAIKCGATEDLYEELESVLFPLE
ncbi:uncharacterized protein LOC141630414 [Silene latifolia]|uniref:uncharacterized protein LOC141630414 n=1 Tax=Silene latifolia TaxID=37657 RepID=UPI003D7881FC